MDIIFKGVLDYKKEKLGTKVIFTGNESLLK